MDLWLEQSCRKDAKKFYTKAGVHSKIVEKDAGPNTMSLVTNVWPMLAEPSMLATASSTVADYVFLNFSICSLSNKILVCTPTIKSGI